MIELTDAPAVPYYKRKIQCPAHYMVPPDIDIWLYEPVPRLQGVNVGVCEGFLRDQGVANYKVRKMRRKLGRDGKPMIDWQKMYMYRKQGKVLQPFMSASFVIEHVYDPLSPICIKCQGRCLEGKNGINTGTIKRLSG